MSQREREMRGNDELYHRHFVMMVEQEGFRKKEDKSRSRGPRDSRTAPDSLTGYVCEGTNGVVSERTNGSL